MLWTIALLLVVLWGLGLVTSYTLGGFIHILLVLAVVAVAIRVDPRPSDHLTSLEPGVDMEDPRRVPQHEDVAVPVGLLAQGSEARAHLF